MQVLVPSEKKSEKNPSHFYAQYLRYHQLVHVAQADEMGCSSQALSLLPERLKQTINGRNQAFTHSH